MHGETKGYTTVPEAEAEFDIFHPNCIHTLRITAGVLQQYEYLKVYIPKDTQVKYEDKLQSIDNVYLYNNKSDILAKLYPSELNALNTKEDKRVLLKSKIKDRNRNKHNDLTNADFRNALTALYKPTIILPDSGNPNYYHFIRTMNNINYVVLLDKAPKKDFFEIVHIHKMRDRGLKSLIKKHKK